MRIEPKDIETANTRIKAMALTWLRISMRSAVPDKHLFVLNPALASKVVFHYISDLNHLKKRYGLTDKAQPPKAAGLMANAILKYRPLVPVDSWDINIGESQVNEYLAILHGIAVCAQYDKLGAGNREMAALMAKPHFRP